LTSPAGGFYSTTDADSEGVEGKFFVWSLDEVKQILGDEADFASAVFDISEGGNWKGILFSPGQERCSRIASSSVTEEAFLQRVDAIKSKLLTVRERRIQPGRDENDTSSVERTDDLSLRPGRNGTG